MNRTQHNIQHEIDSWLRMLDYLQQEIVYMKTQLAEVVKGDVSKDVLARMEDYQNIFTTKDTVIAFFRKDIQALKKQLNGDSHAGSDTHTLRTDLRKMELEFYSLKVGFNECVMQIV